jgi:hypothetical protein
VPASWTRWASAMTRRAPLTPAQFSYHVHLASRLLPHGQRPTRLHLRVARLLARWQHPCPSHGKLARAAGCCVRTVQNALGRFRDLGMLKWQHQGATMRSGRRLQLPNRYLFMASCLLFPARAKEGRVKTQDPNLHLGKLRQWWQRPMPQPPIRTVAQQLAMLGGAVCLNDLLDVSSVFGSRMVVQPSRDVR